MISDSVGTLMPLGHNKSAFCTVEVTTNRSLSAKTQFASPSFPAICKELSAPSNVGTGAKELRVLEHSHNFISQDAVLL